MTASTSLKGEVEESASLQRQLGDLRIDLESARRELDRMRKDNVRVSKIELLAQLQSARDRIHELEIQSKHESGAARPLNSSRSSSSARGFLAQRALESHVLHGSPSSVRTVSPIQSNRGSPHTISRR